MSDKTKPGVGVSGTEDIFAVTGEPPVEQAYLALGNDWAQIIEAQREPMRSSWSIWAPSTRPPMASCVWCLRWTGRP